MSCTCVLLSLFIGNAEVSIEHLHKSFNALSLEDTIAKITKNKVITENEVPHNSSLDLRFRLYDRKQELDVISRLARENWHHRGDNNHNNHNFLIIPGASGIGKTRMGYEVSQLVKTLLQSTDAFDDSGEHEKELEHSGEHEKGPHASKIISKYIRVDFNNGERFVKQFDSNVSDSLRLGVRLAATGLLNTRFLTLAAKPPAWYQAFEAHAVLAKVVEAALQKEHDTSAVVALVLHFDEFQAYVDAFGNPADGRVALKGILRMVGDFMRTGLRGGPLERRFFVVPVLTGTAARDVNFLRTDRYKEWIVLLDPLRPCSALAMCEEKFGTREDIFKQNHFRVALFDTGHVPRIIDHLLSVPGDSISVNTDWGSHLRFLYLGNPKLQRSLQIGLFGGVEAATAVIHFTLSAQIVDREFVLPGAVTVGELERRGELLLVPVKNSGFRMWLPFVQLVALNELLIGAGRAAFESSLLFSPTPSRPWRWQDFEELHAHFQALRMKSLLAAQEARLLAAEEDLDSATKNYLSSIGTTSAKIAAAQKRTCEAHLQDLRSKALKGFPLKQVCPGALGDAKTLARCVLLTPVRCYHETNKWIIKTVETPAIKHSVNCTEGIIPLESGVFLCTAGTAVFDGRFVCASAGEDKPVLIAWQDKHTELDANGTVNCQFILNWLQRARQCLHRWSAKFDVVHLFLTNRRRVDEFSAAIPHDLLVVTQVELTEYLSPTLAGRGLIPFD